MGINIADPEVNGIPTPKLYAGVRGLELLKGRDGKTFDLILTLGLDIAGQQKAREKVLFLNRPEITVDEDVEVKGEDGEVKGEDGEVTTETQTVIQREAADEIPPEIRQKLDDIIAWAYEAKINAAYPGAPA